MQVAHLIMVNSYTRIFELPVRIISNVIRTVSGGVKIQIQTCVTQVCISEYVDKSQCDLRLEKKKVEWRTKPVITIRYREACAINEINKMKVKQEYMYLRLNPKSPYARVHIEKRQSLPQPIVKCLINFKNYKFTMSWSKVISKSDCEDTKEKYI